MATTVREAMSEVYVHQYGQETTKKAPYLHIVSSNSELSVLLGIRLPIDFASMGVMIREPKLPRYRRTPSRGRS